ncbi:MAG TPA: hypothetical protein P5114_08185 [Hyphomicrobiaceae bacterium]|nr:hypothetical protein [Hyphomicrobiaceae bacterium]
MATIEWPKFNEIENGKLTAARRQAHNAVHWLVRFANSYIEPEDGNGHTRLVWNERDGVIQTKRFLNDYSVELRVGPLEMQFREGDAPVPHTLDFEERTPAHVEAWVLVELLHRGIDRSRYNKALPYTASNLMTGDNEDFESEAYKRELQIIDQSFRSGAPVIQALRHVLDANVAADAQLSCWPEPFQIGFEIDLPPGSGSKRLRVGIAPGDGVRPEPYFFVGAEQQAQAASFPRENVLSLRDVAGADMDIDAAVTELSKIVQDVKRKLSG